MPSAIFAIYCHILLSSRSGSALRIAEVDEYLSGACSNDVTCAEKCCSAATEQKNPVPKDQKECLGLVKKDKKYFWYDGTDKKCYSYTTCVDPVKGSSGTDSKVRCKSLTQTPTYVAELWEPKQPGASRDPHVVNMAGEKFDILATGAFSLLSLTRATEENLMINGTIARFGAKCGESFITDLEHSGGWIRKAYNTEALKVRAVQNTPQKQALQVNFGQKWEPLSHLQEMAHISKTGDTVRLDLSSMTVQVSAGKHWRHGWNFLNLDVQGLASLDDSIRVGGLLGYDDHTQVLQADADCAMFAEAAGTDMQDQQSCLSYLKAN